MVYTPYNLPCFMVAPTIKEKKITQNSTQISGWLRMVYIHFLV